MLAAFFSAYYIIQLFDISRNALLLKLIGIFACIGLNYYKDGANPNKIYGFVAQLNYDFIFLIQGLVDHIYLKE
jgi:hypothetical protein